MSKQNLNLHKWNWTCISNFSYFRITRQYFLLVPRENSDFVNKIDIYWQVYIICRVKSGDGMYKLYFLHENFVHSFQQIPRSRDSPPHVSNET